MEQKTMGWLLVGASLVLIVVLGLVKADIDRQGAYLCEAVAADPELDMASCPAHQSSASWFLLAGFVVSAVVALGGAYLILTSRRQDFKKVDISKLDDDEKRVYEALKKSGSMYQSDLIKETGFSKVKMTRVLDKMATKDIIDRKRRGMTNLIILK